MTNSSNDQADPTIQATDEDYKNFLQMARQAGPNCGGGTPGKFAVHKVFFAEHEALKDFDGRYVPVEPTNIRPGYLAFLAGLLQPVLDAALAAQTNDNMGNREILEAAAVKFFQTANTNMDMRVIDSLQATYFRDWKPLSSLVGLVQQVQANCRRNDPIIPVVANTHIEVDQPHSFKPGAVQTYAGRKYQLIFTWTPFPTDAAWKPPTAQ
jgi:hypothetical protein